jgi:hypothetical protein
MATDFAQHGSRIDFVGTTEINEIFTYNQHVNPYSGGEYGDGPQPGEAAVIGRIVGVVVNAPLPGAGEGDGYLDNNSAFQVDPTAKRTCTIETEGTFKLFVYAVDGTIEAGGTCYIATLGLANGTYYAGSGATDPLTGDYLNGTIVSNDPTGVPFGSVVDIVPGSTSTQVRVRLFGATPGEIGASS